MNISYHFGKYSMLGSIERVSEDKRAFEGSVLIESGAPPDRPISCPSQMLETRRYVNTLKERYNNFFRNDLLEYEGSIDPFVKLKSRFLTSL